jgi:predicted PurR-regulated permease PerM
MMETIMSTTTSQSTVARWYFIILALLVAYVYWQIISPYFLVLVTAAIVAVVVSPLEDYFRRLFRSAKLSSALMVLLVFVAIVGPVTTVIAVMGQQFNSLVSSTVADPEWRDNFSFSDLPFVDRLPGPVQAEIVAQDPTQVLDSIATWIQDHLANIFSSSAAFIFRALIFFICLFFFLLDREKIYAQMLELSPLKDSVDRSIVARMVETVRGVVFGALIVSIIQGIVAGIGLTLFGVPGAILWAAFIVIAAQIPILGTGTVMVPAVLYLFFTGHEGAAIGLAIWGVTAVGLIDNILSPLIVGRRTRMHALLILLSILGGLEFFGPIGFIMGPTVLAAFLVVIELYKAGILEKGKSLSIV